MIRYIRSLIERIEAVQLQRNDFKVFKEALSTKMNLIDGEHQAAIEKTEKSLLEKHKAGFSADLEELKEEARDALNAAEADKKRSIQNVERHD